MQSDIITTYIGNSQRRFDQLRVLVFTNEKPVARRAASVMGHCCREHQGLVAPHLEPLVDLISANDTHPAIIRNTLLIIQTVEIPTDLKGIIFNLCYDMVDNPNQTLATRVYAVSILARIHESKPELVDEVELLIKQHIRHSSTGFKSRTRWVLNDLKKIR
jgi:hypothetical protein